MGKVSKGTETGTIARDEVRVDRQQMVEHHPRIGTLIISSIIISTVILTSITIVINPKP